LLDAIEKQLKSRFEELRDQKYNTNTKGYDYEEILKAFLEDYIGGAFDILIRIGVLDIELKALSTLKPYENEFDIVGLYKNAVPRLVHHRWVPYDSVAFIIEVKQTLQTPFLRKDLEKLSKLTDLKLNENRIRTSLGYIHKFGLKRPVRVLFYYEKKANSSTVFEELNGKYSDAWDLCIILKDNLVLINNSLNLLLPKWKEWHFRQSPNHALIKGMVFCCLAMPMNYVNSWGIFLNLIFSSMAEENHG
jgi:hypothetical protein